jgi:hypothetical protein
MYKDEQYKTMGLVHLHEEVTEWIKELEFIQDEYDFLTHLLSSHFLELSSKDSYEAAKKKIQLLGDMNTRREELSEFINTYDKKIATLTETNHPEGLYGILKEHTAMKSDVESFVLNFKYLKKKIFRVIKDILKSQKQLLISGS